MNQTKIMVHWVVNGTLSTNCSNFIANEVEFYSTLLKDKFFSNM